MEEKKEKEKINLFNIEGKNKKINLLYRCRRRKTFKKFKKG